MPERISPAESPRPLDPVKVISMLEAESARSPQSVEYANKHPWRKFRSTKRLVSQIERAVSEGNPWRVASYLLLPELREKEEVSLKQQVEYMRSAYQHGIEILGPVIPTRLSLSYEEEQYARENRTPEYLKRLHNSQVADMKKGLKKWTEDVYGPEINPENIKEAAIDFVKLFYQNNIYSGLAIMDESYKTRLDEAWSAFYNKYPTLKPIAFQFREMLITLNDLSEKQPQIYQSFNRVYSRHLSPAKPEAREILTQVLIARTVNPTGQADYGIDFNKEKAVLLQEIGASQLDGLTGEQVAEAILSGRLRFTYQKLQK